jgi:hypothetical protein
MPMTVMLDDPGSNPGVNHGCMYLSRRKTSLVLSNYVVNRQLGKKPVDVSVCFICRIVEEFITLKISRSFKSTPLKKEISE